MHSICNIETILKPKLEFLQLKSCLIIKMHIQSPTFHTRPDQKLQLSQLKENKLRFPIQINIFILFPKTFFKSSLTKKFNFNLQLLIRKGKYSVANEI